MIHNREEYERVTNELMRLDDSDALTPEEQELAALLTLLVDEY